MSCENSAYIKFNNNTSFDILDQKLILVNMNDYSNDLSVLQREVQSGEANYTRYLPNHYGSTYNNLPQYKLGFMKLDGSNFTLDDKRKFQRWLTTPILPSKLEIFNSEDWNSDYYFQVTFTDITEVRYNGTAVMVATFQADSEFSYKDESYVRVLKPGEKISISCNSDINYTYPKITINDDIPIVTLTPGDKSIYATWTSVKNATKYRIFTYDGKYHKIDDTTNTYYTITGLTNGKRIGVIVIAYVKGRWCPASDNYDIEYDTTYTTPNKYPAPIVDSKRDYTYFSWWEMNGIIKYRIIIYDENNTSVDEATFVSDTSYKSFALNNNKTYHALLRYYTDEMTYNSSEYVYFTTPELGTDMNVTLIPDQDKINVSWDSYSGATKYKIYKYYNGKSTDLGEVTDLFDLTYTVEGLTAGEEYGIIVSPYVNSVYINTSTLYAVYCTLPLTDENIIYNCSDISDDEINKLKYNVYTSPYGTVLNCNKYTITDRYGSPIKITDFFADDIDAENVRLYWMRLVYGDNYLISEKTCRLLFNTQCVIKAGVPNEFTS